jgi:hypothetical protein
MKAFQRGLLVAVLAVLAGLVVRLRSKSSLPAVDGGWRELREPDFR